MTAFTDYLLAAASALFAAALWRRYRTAWQVAARLWVGAFAATAVGAAAGGCFHGSGIPVGDVARGLLWKGAVYSIGVAGFFMLSAAAVGVCRSRIRTGFIVLAVLELVVYGFWMMGHNGFRYMVIDYASAMLAVLLLYIYAWVRRREHAAGWIGTGVLISFVGIGVEAAGWPEYSSFNHDVLYHLTQLAALYLFYRGACLARDR